MIMKIYFVLSLLVGFPGVARAQSAPIAPSSPPVAFDARLKSGSWLASRGVLSVDEISALTGAKFSSAERVQLEGVVAARNAALERFNAQLSKQLGEILKQDNAQIATRIKVEAAQSAEEVRMKQLKRMQPSRYQGMMRRKRADAPK